MIKLNYLLKVSIFVTFITLCAGCKAQTPRQAEYGDDISYFMGLRAETEGDIQAALSFYKTAAKSESPIISQKAQLAMVKDKPLIAQLSTYLDIHTTFKTDKTLLDLCRLQEKLGNYDSIIVYTKDIDLTTCDNDIAAYRIKALNRKNDERLKADFYTWCTSRLYTAQHNSVYSEITNTELIADYIPVIELRSKILSKKYAAAYELIPSIIDREDFVLPQILRDTGRAFLYGSRDNKTNAETFENILSTTTDKDSLFYVYFYLGRIYDSMAQRTKALDLFKSAMENASTDELYDNALWYYLNTSLKISTDAVVDSLQEYCTTWHDKEYYDDFFDALSVKLISSQSWNDFYRICNIIRRYASSPVKAKYCYISARLIQEGLIKDSQINGDKQETVLRLFSSALSSGDDVYYKLMAAYHMDIPVETLYSNLDYYNKDTSIQIDYDAQKLLEGYADFGFPELIYDEWLIYQDNISMATTKKLAQFLYNCADYDKKHEYYVQSIRIAARKAYHPDTALDKDILMLNYPLCYDTYVTDSCKRFDQSEYLLYGLMRTESFFDADVHSHAGAVGLTQLMESTAGDVAKKLKVKEYDLLNPETNITFGSYYLEELIRRLDGKQILAIFSYNGGISRVRSWYKTACKEYGLKEVPKDLFLESIPFSETRDYGRKVTAAAVMYGVLYYNKSGKDIISEIME